MKRNLILCLVAMATLAIKGYAEEYRVALDQVEEILAVAAPGDHIVVLSGEYRDQQLRWSAKGSEQAPIRISCEEAGGVVIRGGSSLRIAGEWIEVDGLRFVDGYAPKGAVVEFRLGQEVANHCRISGCVIDNYNPDRRDITYSYVELYGRHNRVDHCSFLRKYSLGVTLYVILSEERSQQNYHRIDHNWFGPRPVYGSNGAETIRVGTSQQAHTSSFTLIEENLFERCNGEVEVVSIKSGDNTIRGNRFWECEGVLALRHGDRNTVEGNIFVGNGKRNTGGIRVVNADHKIIGNRLYGLAGGRFFSALALMNAVPNSLPNRYVQVERVDISENLFVDCAHIEFGTGRDQERTLAPDQIRFISNSIHNPSLDAPFMAIDRVDGFTFSHNRVRLASRCKIKGFSNDEFDYPTPPTYDQMREGCGAEGYRLAQEDSAEVECVIEVESGAALRTALVEAPAGARIVLTRSGGDYAIDGTLCVDRKLTIEAAEGLAVRPVVRYVGRRKENMITIADGANLVVRGLHFSGVLEPGKALAAAGISTAERMIRPYNLMVEGCEFSDFGEGGFFAIKGTISTFAERVEIRDCLFRNLSGDAIHYAAERDDKGRYSADDVVIERCSFFRLLGLPINIYRGGSDESTAGPYVEIRDCNFEDCCNKERGSVIRAIGPQVMEIAGCNFSRSGRGGAAIRLDEASWEQISIHDCNFWEAGRIISMSDRVITGEMTHEEPRYVNAENYDFRRQ